MQHRSKKIKKSFLIILVVLIVLSGGSAIYLGNYYHSVDVEKYMNGSSEVSVKKFDKGWFFDGAGEEKALIFYPGAKVATEAYAPLMYQLAENGVDCFLVEMPFHMAFFGMNRAEEIMQEYNYEAWYLGGHSLGGAMAANFAADYVEDHTDGIRGLLLLAAYPTKDLSTSDMSVVTVYGSEDGVLNMDKIVAGRKLMPQDYKEVCVEGGNHAQFGSYGAQKGDGTAAIPAEEQWARTVEVFVGDESE